uniref:Uncharacterized protein n=1 Tax=Solanum tuberosum TaxID=4113 RepID=M1CX18_SOLTU
MVKKNTKTRRIRWLNKIKSCTCPCSSKKVVFSFGDSVHLNELITFLTLCV